MDEPHKGDNFVLAPSPAYEGQARFSCIDLQMFALLCAGVAGLYDMFHFVGLDDLQKVFGRLQVFAEFLFQELWHQLGIDVTILKLHWHVFFAVRTNQMKNRRARGQAQGGSD